MFLQAFLLLGISIIPCMGKNQTFIDEKESILLKYRNPRSEIEQNITSGEQAWLSFQNRHAFKQQTKNNPKKISKDSSRQARVLNPPPPLFRKNRSKRERQRLPSIQKKSSEKKLLRNEFHPLSEHHALTQTSHIDRVTVARLINLAHDGSVDSYYFLGLIYLYGLNEMTPNAVKAKEWFEKAAKAGHTEGQCALGLTLHHGIGDVKQDTKMAMHWFYRAAIDSRNQRAYWLLGRSLYEGLSLADISIDPETLTSLLGIEIQAYIASGTKAGFFLAAHLFCKANKIHEATHHLALMFEYGLVPDSFSLIVEEVEESSGDENSMRHRFHASESKIALTRFEKAAELYRKAAHMGNTESLYNLGLMYTYGRGLPLNYVKAKNFFQQAIVKKHSPSMRYLAIMAMNGWGQIDDVPNPKEAIYWLQQCISVRNELVKKMCQRELHELKSRMDDAEAYRMSTIRNL